MDLTTFTDEELDALRVQVLTELEHRATRENAPAQAEALARAYRQAVGAEPGEPWTQPTGAHDALPEGWTVTHDGKLWRSTVANNVWPPGEDSRWWDEVKEEGAGPEPWSAGTYYKVGDTVTHAGEEWKCTHEHLGQAGWEPSNPSMHAVWKRA